MIYIGLWVTAICACASAAEVYPTLRKYFRNNGYQNTNQAKVKTTITMKNRRTK